MKKVILMILAIVLTISTVLSVTGFALAENEVAPAEAVAVRTGLAIKAPAVAKAGEPFRIQIVTRPREIPVSGAEVWAVGIDNTGDVALTADAASLTQCHGRLLGTTNDRGYVDPMPQIGKRGKYLLVAIHPDYAPGFSMIKITSKVPLTLRAPDTAKIRELVMMNVTDPSGQGVGRAAIFAIPLLNTSNDATITGDYDRWLKEAEAYAETLESPTTTSRVGEEIESQAQIRRYFLGFTSDSGNFEHRFTQAGPYLLIAAKCGYTPDFHIIKITGSQLNLRSPETARIKEIVPMNVSDATGQGVGRATIFAIPLLSATDDATITGDYDHWLKEAEPMPRSWDSPTTTSRVGEEVESWDQIRCYFLGFTDGSVNFEHRFTRAGAYLLIAAKCGYTPDCRIIKIIGPELVTPDKVNAVQVEQVKVEEVQISLKSK
jgi:hypothetical protein